MIAQETHNSYSGFRVLRPGFLSVPFAPAAAMRGLMPFAALDCNIRSRRFSLSPSDEERAGVHGR